MHEDDRKRLLDLLIELDCWRPGTINGTSGSKILDILNWLSLKDSRIGLPPPVIPKLDLDDIDFEKWFEEE